MKTILVSTVLNIIVWVLAYACIAFARWELYHPFQWIIDIPTYSTDGRVGVLTGLVFYYFILIQAAKGIIIEHKKAVNAKKTNQE